VKSGKEKRDGLGGGHFELIGGFATRFQGLLSRNPDDFKPWFPALRILVP